MRRHEETVGSPHMKHEIVLCAHDLGGVWCVPHPRSRANMFTVTLRLMRLAILRGIGEGGGCDMKYGDMTNVVEKFGSGPQSG